MRKNKGFSQKGQAVLVDLLFASLVFLLVFSAINTAWENEIENVKTNIEANEAVQKAILISDSLVKSKGTPENWNELSVGLIEKIGLAESNLSLDTQKVNQFKNLDSNYAAVKQILQIPQYDYFFQLDGAIDVNAGLAPPAIAEKTVIQRIVEFEGDTAIVVFTLYKMPQ